MKLTAELKKWLSDRCGIKAEATDDEFRTAAAAALARRADEKDAAALSAEEFGRMTTDPDAGKANALQSVLEKLAAGQEAMLKALQNPATAPATPAPAKTPATDPAAPATPLRVPEGFPSGMSQRFAQASDGSAVQGDARHKGAWEQYRTTKSERYYPQKTRAGRAHPLAGERVSEGGREGRRYIDEPSDLERAVSGAWIKYQVNCQMRWMNVPHAFKFTPHDKELIDWAKDNAPWGGVLGGECEQDRGATPVYNRRLLPHEKALIDDATSGGLEIAPIFFDDQIILTPLLYGELFPLVNMVNITRGRRIEGASMGNVTITSGGGDDVAITLFTTTAFVAAFDTTIFVYDGAIEIGLDFMSDSPIDVQTIIAQQYSDRLLNVLDDHIAQGNGTTQIEGVLTATGTTSVSFGSTTATVGGYEQLLFGVAKAYKQGYATNRIVFASNETSYRRARAIAVGTSDQRRVFGMDHESYTLFDHPYKIVPGLANAEGFFANLARFRLYRRLGLTMRVSTEGTTLIRRNMMLMVARARFGGQLEDGAAASVTIDMAA